MRGLLDGFVSSNRDLKGGSSITHEVKGIMIDTERIDEAVLALLYLGLHERNRAWKGFDWDVVGRLHQKGYITDPVGKAKSVVLTEEGLKESQRLFKALFTR